MPLENKRARRGRGEASIFQRESDGRWVASLSLGFDADGKRKRKTVYGSTKNRFKMSPARSRFKPPLAAFRKPG